MKSCVLAEALVSTMLLPRSDIGCNPEAVLATSRQNLFYSPNIHLNIIFPSDPLSSE